MKGDLDLGMFTELNKTEAEMVGGGSLLSSILDTVHKAIDEMAFPIPVVGIGVMVVTDTIVAAIEGLATPIYSLIGWKFRG